MRIETIKSGKNNLVGKIIYKNKLCVYKKYLKTKRLVFIIPGIKAKLHF